MEFINFPENVKEFEGVVTRVINTEFGEIKFNQYNEQELKIKLKYLLAYQQALRAMEGKIERAVYDELEHNTSVLLDLFLPINYME